VNLKHFHAVSAKWRESARVSQRTTAAPRSDYSHEHDLATWHITAATNDTS